MLICTTHSVVNLEQSHPTSSLWDIVAHRTVLVLRKSTTSDKNYLPGENICNITEPGVAKNLCSSKLDQHWESEQLA